MAAADTTTIPLTQGFAAIVDAADFDWLNQWKWQALVRGNITYARRFSRQTARSTIPMHRAIMDAPADRMVDHINRNGLDNRRCNLRLCVAQQNSANSAYKLSASGFRGVHRVPGASLRPWRVFVGSGVGRCIGRFATAEEAARSYDAAAIERWGEFATLNYPIRSEAA